MSAPIDYEVEYNNRARVPENPALIAGWARDAAAYRARNVSRLVRYGAGARNVIDYFFGGGNGPVVVFIHGGYWQALDNSFFGHLAGGLNAHGIDVAIPSYDLCPDVTIDRIIAEMREACRELARLGQSLVVSGHSAGGHLAAYSISGLFDLAPLVATSINRALQLDAGTAKAASPLFWNPPAGKSLDAVVGENESAEYFRQSQTIVDAWGAAGVVTRFGVVAGANHFTAIAPLADPASLMVSRLKQLAGR